MGYDYYPSAAGDDSATTVSLTVAGFVGALALLALGLYAMQPPTTLRSDPSAPDGRRLLALHVAGISGAEREWIEADLAAVRRRLEHDCIRGLARRRGPAEWQVIDGPALSVALAVEGVTASSSVATETVFISPATPPRIATPPPTATADPAAAAPVVPDRPGFRTHPASSVSLAAVSAVRRFPSFDAAAAATPPVQFIVAGAGPSDPAFYAVTTTTAPLADGASGGTVVVADPTAGTSVYERV